MRRQNRIRRLRAANVLIMASTASAMTLSNFQIITSASVPLGCIAAYNAPIFGCQASDFTYGRTCSASCIRALHMTENLIQSVCDNVSADKSTVLGEALQGTLVENLCSSGRGTTTVTSTRTIGSFSAIPTPSLQTSTRTTETSTSTTTSSDDDTETETEMPTETPTAYPQPTETIGTTSEVDPSPVVTTTVIPVQTTTTAQKTNTPTQQPDSDSGSGGGSPFDAVTVSAASRQMMDRWLEASLFANVFVFLLLR